MAYVSQEMKAKIKPAVDALLKKHGLKGSLRVVHHSKLVLTVRQGRIDFFKNEGERYAQVNPYWCHEHYDGEAREFLVAAVQALKGPDYFDHSDAMTDYFHCSHYVGINIGQWDKPYALVK